MPAPPPARALAAPRDVTLGYKSRGARLSRRWRSSRLRAGPGRRGPGTPGRERLCDVLLRAAHRGQPQGDRHAAAAPNEASRAVHPQGLSRPAAPGRPQEAGLVQGHGEPRGRPRLGAPRDALRAARSPGPPLAAFTESPAPARRCPAMYCFVSGSSPSSVPLLQLSRFRCRFSSSRALPLCLLPSCVSLPSRRDPALLLTLRSPFLPVISNTEFDCMGLEPRSLLGRSCDPDRGHS